MSDGGDGNEAARATLDDWKLLDVMPGVPERVLRTAYARKLKVMKPETDPDGFQRLRAAYERALESLADNPADAQAAPASDGAPASAPSAEADATALADLMHGFESRRRRGDVEGALALVDEALSGTFRAAWRNAIEDALFDSIAEDRSARFALVRELAERFDWGEATGRQADRSAATITGVRERAEAAALAESFRARAAAARAGTGPHGDRILARILGPYRVGLYDRALSDPEREVAVEFMSAYHRLSELDGFVDPRMLSAVRAALGAAPLASPPPQPQAAAGAMPPASPRQPAAKPKARWGANFRYIYLALLVLLFAGRAFQGTFNTSPDAPTYSSSIGRPDIPQTLDVTWRDNDGLLNMQPLLQEQFLDKVAALRVAYGAESKDIPITDLRENSIVTIPKGEKEMMLRLVFADGTLGPNKHFELDQPKDSQPGPEDPRRNPIAPDASPVPRFADPPRREL